MAQPPNHPDYPRIKLIRVIPHSVFDGGNWPGKVDGDATPWPYTTIACTCVTLGCENEGMTFYVSAPENADGEYRAECGKCAGEFACRELSVSEAAIASQWDSNPALTKRRIGGWNYSKYNNPGA